MEEGKDGDEAKPPNEGDGGGGLAEGSAGEGGEEGGDKIEGEANAGQSEEASSPSEATVEGGGEGGDEQPVENVENGEAVEKESGEEEKEGS